MPLDAWFMDGLEEEDQRLPHRLEPNQPVSLDALRTLGVFHWKNDPELEKIRKEHGYSYSDVITIQKETLPNYEEKLKTVFAEHLHLDDEIRYIVGGQAYFDVRSPRRPVDQDRHEEGGPDHCCRGIYHRFTLDQTNYTKAMRLFVGEPVWKAYRPACRTDFEERQKYLASLPCD
ncbi:hypothetical protein CRUP_032724 [Coryphaenoides rupestris]|nr:hypothetical protein CRUP_032724 [Coryphaenoides rupestris]